MNTDDLNKDDELVVVQLPRSEAVLLKDIIKERAAYNLFTGKLKDWWVFVVASGLLTLFAFGDYFASLFSHTPK